MKIENLKENEVAQVNSLLEKLSTDNSDIKWESYHMDLRKSSEMEQTKIENKLDSIESKIDNITNKIEFIFSSNILIEGNFVDFLSVKKSILEKR